MKLLKDFFELNTIDFSKTFIVSVSGGLDSMVLLDTLYHEKLNIAVVHFNHNIRQESIKEADMVSKYCMEKNIPFNYIELSFSDSSNFQNKARTLRYNHLKKIAQRYKTPYILTAHHLDDLLETILMKLTRGSNLLGYSGMEMIATYDNFTYIRPFLYLTKDQLKDIAIKNNIPYMEDITNYQTNYTRNRYRLAIIPIMKQENENLLTQAEQFSKQVNNAYHFIRNETIKYLNDKDEIELKTFKKLDTALQEDIICYLLEKYNLNINYRIIEKAIDVLLSKKPNQSLYLSSNYQLIKFYNRALIKNKLEFNFTKIKLIDKPQTETNFFFTNKKIPKKNIFSFELLYDENKIEFPLWLRNRKNGDILEYDYGHKKLKDLLIDKKIPKQDRNNLLILTDNKDEILWIKNLYTNKKIGNTKKIYINQNLEENDDKKLK